MGDGSSRLPVCRMAIRACIKPGQLFDYQDVLKFLVERPDVVSLNSTIPRDQGYISALSEEVPDLKTHIAEQIFNYLSVACLKARFANLTVPKQTH